MTPTDAELEAREVALEEEHLNLRKLPPVTPLPRPRRFSQTLLRHSNTCKRAGYLYVRHHGGMPRTRLDRGSAYHLAQAKFLDLLMEQHAQGAPEGSDPERIDEDTAKLLLEEVLAEHPELTIPLHERDELRVMMVHLANGVDIDPGKIVGVERKFVLDLGEFTISGILDVACIDGTIGKVRDSKTEWMPAQDDYEATFQGRLYTVLLVFGNPVSVLTCPRCEGQKHDVGSCGLCENRGYIEELEPPLGNRLEEVDVGEWFPRHLREDGKLGELSVTFTRMEIESLRRDIEDQCRALAHAFDTGEFPAVSGSHCQYCPCEPECPLPPHLRRFAGKINTDDRAKEAAQWEFFWRARLDATRKELKIYARANEAEIRFGTDQVWRFVEVHRSAPIDWEAIEQANREAAATGQLVDVEALRTRKPGSEFKRVKLSEKQLVEERDRAEE